MKIKNIVVNFLVKLKIQCDYVINLTIYKQTKLNSNQNSYKFEIYHQMNKVYPRNDTFFVKKRQLFRKAN